MAPAGQRDLRIAFNRLSEALDHLQAVLAMHEDTRERRVAARVHPPVNRGCLALEKYINSIGA